MITIRRSADRGTTKLPWLLSRHSFSFGDYFDSEWNGFGKLRVFNDDVVEPGNGFGMHYHDNFEIISIVLDGALEHTDSMGNKGLIKAGDVQLISAGSGISHAEYNQSKEKKVHFLQVWIEPNKRDITPKYQQNTFYLDMAKNVFVTLVSGKKKKGSLYSNQDCEFVHCFLEKGETIDYPAVDKDHGVFLFVIDGHISLEHEKLSAGDSASITDMHTVPLTAQKESKILLINVPML